LIIHKDILQVNLCHYRSLLTRVIVAGNPTKTLVNLSYDNDIGLPVKYPCE
jgi:hypothetical protein